MTSDKIKSLDKLWHIGRRLGRPDILFWTLPWLMILVFIGTVAQKDMGLYDAQKMFFSSFIFYLYGVPLPGGYTVLIAIGLNLFCNLVFNTQWKFEKSGIIIMHVSILVLLVGGVITGLTMKEGFIPLREGETGSRIMAFAGIPDMRGDMTSLPFDLNLVSFNRDAYPGTNMPRDYESRVVIRDGDITWPAIISMNEPLRYGGFTFYQSSLLIDEDGQPISVFSIVENKGWIFPYVSGILLAIGMIFHIFIRMRQKRPTKI
jgi:hypothetical protein